MLRYSHRESGRKRKLLINISITVTINGSSVVNARTYLTVASKFSWLIRYITHNKVRHIGWCYWTSTNSCVGCIARNALTQTELKTQIINSSLKRYFYVAEIKNRKILEDLQIKKQLIVQKGVSACSHECISHVIFFFTRFALHIFSWCKWIHPVLPEYRRPLNRQPKRTTIWLETIRGELLGHKRMPNRLAFSCRRTQRLAIIYYQFYLDSISHRPANNRLLPVRRQHFIYYWFSDGSNEIENIGRIPAGCG